MNKRIVVIGGGTGSFTLLTRLKYHFSHITALVNMADDGGSTGILRDELGVLPPGDVRQCLVALAREPRVRDLFNYRFDEGTFAGHSFGNLFLTAVQKVTDDFDQAVELASDILNTAGEVVPITLDDVTLVLKTKATTIRGQDAISATPVKQPQLWLEPQAQLNPRALKAIQQADFIVIAPGRLYGSLAPVLLVPGLAEALAASAAPKAYVCNLVTTKGQTDRFTVTDFAAEIERFLHGKVRLTHVLYNNAKPNDFLLANYARAGEYWVEYDKALLDTAPYKAIGGHFVLDTPWRPIAKKDMLLRTLIRHDSEKVASVLKGLAT